MDDYSDRYSDRAALEALTKRRARWAAIEGDAPRPRALRPWSKKMLSRPWVAHLALTFAIGTSAGVGVGAGGAAYINHLQAETRADMAKMLTRASELSAAVDHPANAPVVWAAHEAVASRMDAPLAVVIAGDADQVNLPGFPSVAGPPAMAPAVVADKSLLGSGYLVVVGNHVGCTINEATAGLSRALALQGVIMAYDRGSGQLSEYMREADTNDPLYRRYAAQAYAAVATSSVLDLYGDRHAAEAFRQYLRLMPALEPGAPPLPRGHLVSPDGSIEGALDAAASWRASGAFLELSDFRRQHELMLTSARMGLFDFPSRLDAQRVISKLDDQRGLPDSVRTAVLDAYSAKNWSEQHGILAPSNGAISEPESCPTSRRPLQTQPARKRLRM